MAPTMSIHFDFGGADAAPGTHQDIDDLGPPRMRFKLADNATIDEANPINIPGAGLGPYHSALKHVHLYMDAAAGATVSAVKFYTDGVNTLGTGVDIKVGLQFPTNNSGASGAQYEVATADPTTTDMVAEHSIITSSASIFTYTSASPLSVTISEAGNVMNANGEMTNYLVFQSEVSNTASEGFTGRPNLYWSYTSA